MLAANRASLWTIQPFIGILASRRLFTKALAFLQSSPRLKSVLSSPRRSLRVDLSSVDSILNFVFLVVLFFKIWVVFVWTLPLEIAWKIQTSLLQYKIQRELRERHLLKSKSNHSNVETGGDILMGNASKQWMIQVMLRLPSHALTVRGGTEDED
ncbi:unnamed protein product [Nesidiocoris tenuis]|uniref:Uncharacterized protein n=1 Tax=Nesidiocoris tenuis TaxID=355587 RepID=A0A6H5G813_9HEMI|nr:unnamed protein product [Nesidiocoris tenuis]